MVAAEKRFMRRKLLKRKWLARSDLLAAALDCGILPTETHTPNSIQPGKRMKRCLLPALVCLAAIMLSPSTGHSQTTVKILSGKEKGIAVMIGDELFTKLDIDNYRRPILYPVYGPGETPMTRNHPMKLDVEGEAKDHPHHKSIWCGHGLINGISFWHEEGQIKVDYSKPVSISMDNGKATIGFGCNYVDGQYRLVCKDETRISFSELENGARAIDWDVTIHASERDLLFGDTKEGMMAIRTHPSLRIDKGAVAVNSGGTEGKDIWGKHAEWVDYSAKVEGNHVGVAIFDHPENLRHPTTWHARAYGLVAANPFGMHHFEGKEKGAGDFKLAKGESVRFQYRIVLHSGDAEAAKIGELYDNYKKQ